MEGGSSTYIFQMMRLSDLYICFIAPAKETGHTGIRTEAVLVPSDLIFHFNYGLEMVTYRLYILPLYSEYYQWYNESPVIILQC